MQARPIQLRDPPSAAPPGFRPVVRGLIDRMASYFDSYPGYRALPDGLAFDTVVGRTTVRFRPVPQGSAGHLAEVGEVRTELREPFQSFSDAQIARFNIMASLGAVLREPATGRTVILTRCPLFAGDEARIDHFGILLHAAAMVHDDQLAAGICSIDGSALPEHMRQPCRPAGQPAAWGEADFERLAGSLRSSGIPARVFAQGLVASLHWPEDEGLQLCEGRSGSYLLFSTREAHPALGSGLQCRLELPVELRGDQAIDMVNQLNLQENRDRAAEPSFGAWCPVPYAPSIAWVSFVPESLYLPGLADTLCSSITWRSWKVLQMIRGGENWLQ